MTSRERVLAAMNHRAPDRVPVDIGTTDTTMAREVYEGLAALLGIEPVNARNAPNPNTFVCPDEKMLEALGAARECAGDGPHGPGVRSARLGPVLVHAGGNAPGAALVGREGERDPVDALSPGEVGASGWRSTTRLLAVESLLCVIHDFRLYEAGIARHARTHRTQPSPGRKHALNCVPMTASIGIRYEREPLAWTPDESERIQQWTALLFLRR